MDLVVDFMDVQALDRTSDVIHHLTIVRVSKRYVSIVPVISQATNRILATTSKPGDLGSFRETWQEDARNVES
jgi:hypothetical protein